MEGGNRERERCGGGGGGGWIRGEEMMLRRKKSDVFVSFSFVVPAAFIGGDGVLMFIKLNFNLINKTIF